MKKSLLALAVIGAFAGTAQAQSSVTIYGSFDGGVRHVDNVNGAGDSKTTMSSNGTYNQNRIGFRGTEDLGGGLSARFVLETGWNTGTGALDGNATLGATPRLFQRTATVGLLTPIGAIDFGRQYSVAFKAIAAYEPLGYKWVAIAPTAAAAAGSTGNALSLAEASAGAGGSTYGAQGGSRFDNDIQFSTRLGPVTLLAEYALGEQASSTRDGSAAAVGANYTVGPFTLGGAYTSKKNNVATAPNLIRAGLGLPAAGNAAASFQDNDQWTIGAAFKTGPVRVSAGYINDEQEGAITLNPATGAPFALREAQVRNAWVGVNYAISPALELTGAFYKTKREATTTVGTTLSDGTRDLLIVGVTYALSKRTNLYAEVDTAKLKGDFRMVSGARIEDRQSGVSFGVNHLF